MEICNMDCFNCQYPDCINDEITYKDFQEEENRDKELRVVHKGGDAERRRVYQRDYYSKNRVAELEKKKAYYQKYKEERKAYQREYNRKNKEKIAEKYKSRTGEEKEKFLMRRRQYDRNRRKKLKERTDKQ